MTFVGFSTQQLFQRYANETQNLNEPTFYSSVQQRISAAVIVEWRENSVMSGLSIIVPYFF